MHGQILQKATSKHQICAKPNGGPLWRTEQRQHCSLFLNTCDAPAYQNNERCYQLKFTSSSSEDKCVNKLQQHPGFYHINCTACYLPDKKYNECREQFVLYLSVISHS